MWRRRHNDFSLNANEQFDSFYNWIVFSMIDHSKDGKELVFLYDWMRIARKPNQTLRQDMKMLFELISIPVSESELDIIEKAINSTGNKT